MLKSAFFGAITVGTALCLSISTPTLADDARHQRRGQHHRVQQHHGGHHGPPAHARRHSVVRHHRHQHPVHHHGHHSHHQHHVHRHGHHHQPHGGFHVGVILGGTIGYPVYPPGHHHYVHVTPAWDVRYSPVHPPYSSTYLYLAISPGHAELYVDGQYLGQANSFHNGQLQFPVAPGTHMLQLHLNGRAYSKAVEVRPGAAAIVTARLM